MKPDKMSWSVGADCGKKRFVFGPDRASLPKSFAFLGTIILSRVGEDDINRSFIMSHKFPTATRKFILSAFNDAMRTRSSRSVPR
jgi:hypothetical protein